MTVNELSIVSLAFRVCLPELRALRPRKLPRQSDKVARTGIAGAILDVVLDSARRLRDRGRWYLVAHVLGKGAAGSS